MLDPEYTSRVHKLRRSIKILSQNQWLAEASANPGAPTNKIKGLSQIFRRLIFPENIIGKTMGKNTATRRRLAAAKLRLKLGGWPDIREPLPSKIKWKHKKRYQHLRNQIEALEAMANRTRFRTPIDVRTFAYHVA